MDENEKNEIRANIRFYAATDGVELTEEQVERCLDARVDARAELDAGLAETMKDEWFRARARAEKEGIPIGQALLDETKARHDAFWVNWKKQHGEELPSKGGA